MRLRLEQLMLTHNRSNLWILLLLGSLCIVTPFAIDMYLPAFSRIAADFHRSTPEISLSLSTYFVGFALGQITARCSTALEENDRSMSVSQSTSCALLAASLHPTFEPLWPCVFSKP